MRVEFKVHFASGRRGRKKMQPGASTKPMEKPTRLPRITQLMALAIKFERLLHAGHVKSYADLARLGGIHVSQITRIMALRNLAPDIQENILNMELIQNGDNEPVQVDDVVEVAADSNWDRQRSSLHDTPLIPGRSNGLARNARGHGL